MTSPLLITGHCISFKYSCIEPSNLALKQPLCKAADIDLETWKDGKIAPFLCNLSPVIITLAVRKNPSLFLSWVCLALTFTYLSLLCFSLQSERALPYLLFSLCEGLQTL